MSRLTVIGNVKIDILLFGSVAFFGDNRLIKPTSWILAVRRDIPTYFGNEGSFDYPTFAKIVPRLAEGGEPRMSKRDEGPIRVGGVKVVGISTASVFQAGSTDTIQSKVWVKQFRQLRNYPYGPQQPSQPLQPPQPSQPSKLPQSPKQPLPRKQPQSPQPPKQPKPS
jgi:spore germination protein PE